MTDYVELHCHSHFSLLDGASSPESLIAQASVLGMNALALTDHDAVYGAVPFVETARAQGIQPILGAEMTFEDGAHLTLLAENATGWANLCTLITQARHNAGKGEAALSLDVLNAHMAGLIALSGCRKGHVPAALLRGDRDMARKSAHTYRDLFSPERFWIELQHHLRPEDNGLVADLVDLAHELALGIVATNNVHYAQHDGHRLQDMLVGIRHNTPLDEAAHLLRPNSEYFLKSLDEMTRLFAGLPEALRNTRRIAERCQFDLTYGLQDLPDFPAPDGLTALDYLAQLCDAAIYNRYGEPGRRVRDQLNHELRVIARGRLANYFLIVWDIIQFASSQSILCQGRGSAANSLVAYLLGISPVDPLKHDLVFERFLSDERGFAPDIDIDFDAARREEVIQYIYTRYGREHGAMACTYVTFQARSALRDIGKTLGLPPDVLNQIATQVDTRDGFADQLPETTTGQQLAGLCAEIDHFPRHLGIHNGAFILTHQPISTRIPTEPATMPDRVVVQWDKDGLERAGLVKIDILGLRMLSAIAEARDAIGKISGTRPDLNALTFDDPAVYAMISKADTIGVFQVESRAQAQMLPRFQPRHFGDLIVAISLIRPGPVQGDMVHPYLRRRLGQEPVYYFHKSLKGALAETLGVILFQEQVLKVARDMAGFTPGQGELLRRALGSKRAEADIQRFHDQFVKGAVAHKVPRATAEMVFEKLKAFGGYSFPKSHAAAFAVLVYWSAWLKHYYPLPFYAALLNNQPMGFWSPAVLVNDAKRHGFTVLPVDVNASGATCEVVGGTLRIGLNYIKGFGITVMERVIRARADTPFAHLADFCQRTQLPRRLVEHLILAGGFDAWHSDRRQLLWQLGEVRYAADELPLEYADAEVDLPALSPLEQQGLEYGMLGLSLHEHPLEMHHDWMANQQVLGSAGVNDTPTGKKVRAAGLVVMHQAPPTAKGFHFITLEDENGFINVIVNPQVYAEYRPIIRGSAFLLVEGSVQREGVVTNLLAQSIATFTSQSIRA
jgi:error-prone DNA polymerase